MTLMPTYITIDELMRLGYCTPLVEVGPGVWHHLLFGDVVETVYDPRWWFLQPGFGGGLQRLPGGGQIGGYFAPGDGPPETMNCIGDPAIVSGPIYYDDYGPGGWWGWWGRHGRGRRWRRRHGGRPPLVPPARRGGGAGPPVLLAPQSPPGSNIPSSVLRASIPTSAPNVTMSLASHPNASRETRLRREVEAWLQPPHAAPMRSSTSYASRNTATAMPMRPSTSYVSRNNYATAAPMRQQLTARPSYARASTTYRPAGMQVMVPRARAATTTRSGGIHPGPLTHGVRGLGALLMRALGR